ncbi:hypothetical protein L226DRAFT_561299 [Lentinus tigrinus ALCF2SS1-7]|uniref:HNH nuclease domain-containing protein n=1 Tax=Lentinus tigrinus ALCF2SS1-6 TaxID=1328759 RepID=A0A5C2S651_9APHY|nr:hypothetical protein L227DRAFT_612265 [Lentinus tigrinus ALCF2SS1-6]RPD73620.1 hypothetical protein L226DRAFT_561299 [Lentinus tigrinus ALCF2SS1-7]
MQPRDKLRGLGLAELRTYGKVTIVHPGYDRAVITFPAYDPIHPPPNPPCLQPPHPPQPEGGVALRVVLDACHVITGNQQTFLASDITGDNPIPTDVPILSTGTYYLHLSDKPGTANKYPVVADFRAWTPPKSVPVHWNPIPQDSPRRLDLGDKYASYSASAMSNVVKAKDGRCIITEFPRCIQNAHILPQDQIAWFKLYDMDLYCHNPRALINDTANGLTLRSDVRECLERGGFVFFPLDPSTYLAYSIGLNDRHYAELLHRRPVAMPERVSEFFLYARFAYNVLLNVRPVWEEHGVRVPAALLEAEKANARAKKHHDTPASDTTTTTETSNEEGVDTTDSEAQDDGCPQQPPPPPPETSEEEEERWKARWKAQFPDLNEESVNPPDTKIFSHPDTLRIQRLADVYMAKNPQISMSSDGSRLHDDGSTIYAEDRESDVVDGD